MKEVDVAIIGAGVIGAAVSRSLLQKNPSMHVAVLEKESAPAQHTSGRNSGVVHSGFNLKPGSMKARFCVEGNARLKEFCHRLNIPLQNVGTLVVAQSKEDEGVLEELEHRAAQNGVKGARVVGRKEIESLEPHAAAQRAFHSPNGAITSGREVTKALVFEAKERGCEFLFGRRLERIEFAGSKYHLSIGGEMLQADFVVNCAGLYADRIAHQLGVGLDHTIVPFRGEYYQIKNDKAHLVRSMIYPVPNLKFPFLGVHWTKTIDGNLIVGPSATLAFGRESYRLFDVCVGETARMVSSPAFWKMFLSADLRSVTWENMKLTFSKRRFIQEAAKLVPGVTVDDFVAGKSGNRAQLVDQLGRLVDDMVVIKEERSLHVLNAVSPGFTCALPFADYIVDRVCS